MPVTVEICVETLDAALAAQEGGADRIELCANLAEAGTTPDPELLSACLARLTIGVYPIVRCRTGDFVFSHAEVERMLREVRTARTAGAHGVVIGALLADGTVDREATAALREAARPLPVTFHRAFDETPDASAALETLIALGIDRILTTGGLPTAFEGIDRLAGLVRQANGRVTVLAGGSVRARNAREIVERAGVGEVHARLSSVGEVRALVDAVRAA